MEVRPNIEGQQIVATFSTLPSYSCNPALLKIILTFCFFHILGRPLADTLCMILAIIRMKVLADKRKELSQTIALLIGSKDREGMWALRLLPEYGG